MHNVTWIFLSCHHWTILLVISTYISCIRTHTHPPHVFLFVMFFSILGLLPLSFLNLSLPLPPNPSTYLFLSL
ncbi:uncharacterized protein EI90DRAFT_3027040, partial [Cantharellus anzutake]|uniref:uncharacterized protein n=1 Tax=Cantharellus anzutake TaxID=1750568 RepID=UPI001904AE21